MARAHRVLRSIETPDGGRCVDVFKRPDGTFGYQCYRRDVETGEGWFPSGNYDAQVFPTEKQTLIDARARIGWLDDLPDDLRDGD